MVKIVNIVSIVEIVSIKSGNEQESIKLGDR